MGPIGTVNGIVIDCADPEALARFWMALFAVHIDSVEDAPPRYIDLTTRDGVPTIRFQRVPEPKAVKNRLHLDIEVQDLDAAIARVESLGGTGVRGKEQEFGWRYRVMADPEGNEFCLIARAGS
jgi:predicted enzyme related to lactoylglutathione lyase